MSLYVLFSHSLLTSWIALWVAETIFCSPPSSPSSSSSSSSSLSPRLWHTSTCSWVRVHTLPSHLNIPRMATLKPPKTTSSYTAVNSQGVIKVLVVESKSIAVIVAVRRSLRGEGSLPKATDGYIEIPKNHILIHSWNSQGVIILQIRHAWHSLTHVFAKFETFVTKVCGQQ